VDCDANQTTPDTVLLRVQYARNYLRKIVNLRINLKRLSADDYREFLRRKPRDTQRRQSLRQQAMLVAALLAIVACYVAVRNYPLSTVSDIGATSKMGQSQTGKAPLPVPNGEPLTIALSPRAQQEAAPTTAATDVAFDRDKFWFEGKWLATVISSLVAASFLIYWFSRPKRPSEAQDPTTFAEALEARSENILEKCKTPREVRRFLNYLRLVAAPSNDSTFESIQALRRRLTDFDRQLVDLATQVVPAQAPAENAVKKFYFDQCAIFGLDPKTFLPLE
jgi:hypothetical protein